MKNRKTSLIISLVSLFLISSILHGQSKSKEALGNALAESIVSNDMGSLK